MAIRFATEADLRQILAVYAPNILASTASFEYEVPSEAAFLARYRAITAQFPWLVWEEDGRILGYAYASAPFERAAYGWCAEPSIYLAPEAKGRGIGRKLYTVLEDILQRQGYSLLYAIITSDNARSLRFHQSMGYRFLAEFPGCAYKFGRKLGITWMEKRLPFVDYPQEAPKPWSEIVRSDKYLL